MAPTNKSRAPKPSKVVKPKKTKKGSSASTKNHRFQPFSERIASLKIDPIRRRRKPEDQKELRGDTSTYFGRSLAEWRDLNQSATFTAFAREAAPLCDSLPVVLHNEDKLMDLLVVYIEKRDGLALEPLLSLLSHFAHDLDTRFEKHFQRAVSAVAAVAAKHEDPAVVEWSFNCLAWLFKYLSRLLTPDLRPLYDLMAPYLGKERQRPFIIRFAAESISFLIRKAAARYEQDLEPLDLFVSHVFQDCRSEINIGSGELYHQGVMTLFTESIKGVQSGIHSSGRSILQSMLRHIDSSSDGLQQAAIGIVQGTLTSLIHHTDAETFQPIQDVVMRFVEDVKIPLEPSRVAAAGKLIFTITSVRKGTRIRDWARILKSLQTLVRFEEQHLYLDDTSSHWLLNAVAMVLQTSTLDVVLQNVGIFEKLRMGKLNPYFLQFCDLFARLGQERFQNFLLPQFRKYLIEQCEGSENAIFVHLPALAAQNPGKRLACGDELQYEILQQLQALTKEPDPDLEQIASANLALSALPYITMEENIREKAQAELLSLLHRSLSTADGRCVHLDKFALGACFTSILDDAGDSSLDAGLWPMLCTESYRFVHMEKFWSNLLQYVKMCRSSQILLTGSHMETLEKSVLDCLSMPSSSIRKSVLNIILSIYKLLGEQVPGALEAAIAIESTLVSFETTRSISMNIRRLASGYSYLEHGGLLQKAIPKYCFGLLHLQLSQAWEDSIDVLAEISKSAVVEDTIMSMTQSWLEGVPSGIGPHENTPSQNILDIESASFRVASDFECSNLAKVSAICEQVFRSPHSGRLSIQSQFQMGHAHVPSITSDARGQALRVLSKIPSVAEKRSRMLVPVLLRWAGNADVDIDDIIDESTSTRWNRKDQKAMLSLFAQFTNPKVLYRSEDVYGALLNLSANGDVEIQRSALKAIFTWKDPSVNRYEEHLVNLLDEARFREELAVFLQNAGGDDEIFMRPEDQPKLMPLLLRLLYGRAVASSKNGQSPRRKAIFVALSSYEEDVLGMFVDIVLGPASSIQLLDQDAFDENAISKLQTPLRQQLGMLNMLDDMLETLGPQLESFGVQILNGLLLNTVLASRQLTKSDVDDTPQDLSLLRSVRQIGVQCLVKSFLAFKNLGLSSHARLSVDEIIAPRLDKFATENTQSVSGTLRLLAAWASSPERQWYLIELHSGILEAIGTLLRNPNTKDEVQLFILQDILEHLLPENGKVYLLGSHVTIFVHSIGDVLSQAPSKLVLDACVTSFSLLSGHIHNEQQAQEIISVCSDLLTKPSRLVSNTTKTGLLKTILPLLESFGAPNSPLLYNAVCGLFSRLQDQQSRVLLSNVLFQICKLDDGLQASAVICQDMNSMGSRLDEPDHKRRETAFAKIYERYDNFSLQQWQGILHNSLFYVRDSDDLVNRTSASRALERFIDAASHTTEDFRPLLTDAVLPGIVYGMRNSSELVRSEYLHLLGHMVLRFPEWPAVKDMTTLTANGDDEASFFTNALHIQQHRRLRALRRLSDEATKLSSSNVTQLLIPFLEHFVFEQAEGDAGRALADQTILTLGALSQALNWSAFRATFKRYVGLLGSERHEKVALRLLAVLVDTGASPQSSERIPAAPAASHERPEQSKFVGRTDVVIREMLPPLMAYLHHKDESTVDRRMPVAVTIVRMLLSLPEVETASRLAPVLTDVCHVLRSRSQEARDETRKTLAQVFGLVGPSYLGFILKELRGALQRGYQLHVLSFTVHSLLVNATDRYGPGDLDPCLTTLLSIIMDDIFGATGEEKDAEEYTSSMKEVKSSKSFDTMELLASVTSIQQLGRLIQPLQALLCEKLNSKMLRKIEDLLIRLRKGIDQNQAAGSRDMLIFCHEVMRQSYPEPTRVNGQSSPGEPKQMITATNSTPASWTARVGERPSAAKTNRVVAKTEYRNKAKNIGGTSSQIFRIVSFAFNLLRKLLRRHEDLMTAANLAGFLPIAGEALVAGQEEVQISVLKLLSTIMKVPLADLEINAPVYVEQAVNIIKAAPSVDTDSAKASLDLITSVLRDKRSAEVMNKDLEDVLKALKGNLDEPDRQGIIYKFLRAVLGRKIRITGMYEIMDEVRNILVTNADRNVRESARSVYLQFVLEYPRSKDGWEKKWEKQTGKLIADLQYPISAGRQSVMELLHQLLSKITDVMLGQLAAKLFFDLIPVQTSDEDGSCREMASLLISKLYERADDEQMSAYLGIMDKWLYYEQGSSIRIASLQCWTVLLRTKPPSTKRMEALRAEIGRILDSDDKLEPSTTDPIVANALQTFSTLVSTAPGVGFAKDSKAIWDRLNNFLPDEIGTKLLGTYFTHLASASSKTEMGLSALPLRGFYGLELNGDDMHRKLSSSLRILYSSSEGLSEGLVTQTVRNLVFLGRCFAANGMKRRENPKNIREYGHENDEESKLGTDSDFSALGYLFSRLSYIVRQENIHIVCRTAAIECQAALINAGITVTNIRYVLRSLYSLTDPSVVRNDASQPLTDKARELMDLLKKKIGTDAYIKALGAVGAEAKGKRDDRRAKRRIEVATAPGKRRRIR